MKKIDLENKIKILETDNRFFKSIISKLLDDQIKLKNKPRGKIKERIAVFTNSFRVKNLTCEHLLFLPPVNKTTYIIDNKLIIKNSKRTKLAKL